MTIDVLLRNFVAAGPRGTASKLARQLDVSYPTFSRWQTGKQVPEEHRAGDIAGAIGEPTEAVLAAITRSRLAGQQSRNPNRSISERVEALEEQMGGLQSDVERILATLRKRSGAR